MHDRSERHIATHQAINDIKGLLSDGISVESLENAKAALLSLAEKRHLFAREQFPVPDPEQIDRTFLIYQDDDGGYALYVNSSLPGQTSRPHDHGGAWAIIVAVEGEEVHKVYREASGNAPQSGPRKGCNIEQAGEITVRPGVGISMLPEGIHSIHANAQEPLLHLHLYEKGFEYQSRRKEYDLDQETVKEFVLEDLGLIEDAR